MDVRRTDRKASLASVAGELEMEEQGDSAKLLKSKASAARQSLLTLVYADIRMVDEYEYNIRVNFFSCRVASV